jgi:hypothetical protein
MSISHEFLKKDISTFNPIQAWGGGGVENTPTQQKSLIPYYLRNKWDFLSDRNSVLSIPVIFHPT